MNPAPDDADIRRADAVRLMINGLVQGVGFRPFVYRLATELGLAGRVFNQAADVVVELWGNPPGLHVFQQRLISELPPLAQIHHITVDEMPIRADASWSGFVIEESTPATDNTRITNTHTPALHTPDAPNRMSITADTAPCPECLGELADPANRRFHYPFINCTNCGPRYTLIRDLPYDRCNTAMAEFAQCPACLAEYHNPLDRRFHAQPNACPQCGPALWLVDNHGPVESGLIKGDSDTLILQVLQRIVAGQIVALKGVGGFHLLCDATNARVIRTLRQRKQRPGKPFAVMLANTRQAQQWGQLNRQAHIWLNSAQAPVVLVPQTPVIGRTHHEALQQLAPGLDTLGLMLPQSPLHWLLFEIARTRLQRPDLALVMTSANRSGAPLIINNDQAISELAGIADVCLLHNREILVRNDDSVISCLTEQPLVQRTGRGLSPLLLSVASRAAVSDYSADQQQGGNEGEQSFRRPALLALGSYLKNTIAFGQGDRMCLSQHIGDLDHPDNCRALEQTVQHWLKLMRVTPEAISCDLHPQGFNSQLAQRLADEWQIPLIRVCHHQAHIAAVLADQQWPARQPIAGLALDGFGLGWDGSARGGELLKLCAGEFQHLGSLSALPLAGGDSASREPWRLAAAVLLQLGHSCEYIRQNLHLPLPSGSALAMLQKQLQRRINCPFSSSAGRWFDAVAGLLGLCSGPSGFAQQYEGEAAMRLETLARRGLPSLTVSGPFEDQAEARHGMDNDIKNGTESDLDLYPLFARLVSWRLETNSHKSSPEWIAALFHQQLIRMLGQWVESQLQRHALPRQLVLSGGCLQNSLLRQGLSDWLAQRDIQVLLPRRIPLNDGGLAIGQLWVAQQQLSADQSTPGADHVSCHSGSD
jgi:hydrogenase maturation protein HypF